MNYAQTKKICYTSCETYVKKSSFWYNWKKTFALSCCYTNCGISNSNNNNRTFKEEESIEILKIIHLIDDMNGQNILLVM